jgi:hypothetical protein
MFFDMVLPGKTRSTRLPLSNEALIRGMTHPVVFDMPHAPACIAIGFILIYLSSIRGYLSVV